MNLRSTYSRLFALVKRNKILYRFFHIGNDQRTIATRNNVIYSSAYRGISILLSLWMVPLTLEYLNPTKYGIWLTLTAVIAWLNFFDVGLGNGLRNKLAEALAKKDLALARTYVSTTYAILTIIAIALILLFISVNKYINWASVLNAPTDLNEEIGDLVCVVFLFFSLRFVFGLILTILNADQRVGVSAFMDLVINAFSLLSVYIVSMTVPNSLFILGSALSIVPAVILILGSVWFLTNDYRHIGPALKYVNFGLTRELTHLSFQFFVLQMVVLLIFFSNNIIIAQLLSPAKVAEFNIVHKYFSVITILSVLILNPFWSAATEAYHSGDLEWLRKSARRLIQIWFFISLFVIVMILISDLVYRIWVKDAITISFTASLFMGIYVVILSWHNSFVYLINGIGKIRLQLYIYIAMGALVLPLSYFFIKVLDMGIEGSILSMIVCVLPAALMMPIQFKMLVTGRASGVFNK